MPRAHDLGGGRRGRGLSGKQVPLGQQKHGCTVIAAVVVWLWKLRLSTIVGQRQWEAHRLQVVAAHAPVLAQRAMDHIRQPDLHLLGCGAG